MSGKFMKIKKLIIPTLTVVMIASQLCGCACSKQSETLKMINNGEQIELEIAVPNFEVQGEDTEISWTPLALLNSYAQFRLAFENAMGITFNNGIKEGVVYVDLEGKQTNNSTLYNAFMNSQFNTKWSSEDIQSQLNDGISTTYADLEESDYSAAIINAYFNLLDDRQPSYFNGGASLTRGEAMTMLMRAVTPVEDLKPNETFKSLVEDSEYTEYASYMDSNCFINTSDKSINKQNFNGAMTRAEFVYMVMNQTFGTEAVSKFDSSKVSLNDCKNAGDIAKTEKFYGKNYCNSYVINQMVKNPDSGATDSIYKAIAMAKDYGVIGSETRWDEAITKTEGIDIIVSAFEAKAKADGYKTEVESGSVDTEEITKEAEAKYEENKDKVSCDKKQFTDSYVALIQEGKTSEEAVSSCLATFMNKPDIQVEDPTTNNIDKDKYYLDENGVPQLKEEPSSNSTYTYREDIKSYQDAIIYFRALGYTVSDVPTEAEVRAIYKDYSYIVSEQEFEDSLESCGAEFTLESIAYSLLPSNGNVNTQNSDSVKNEFSGEKAVGEITYNSQSTWQPSNEPTQPSGPNIDNPNGRPGGTFDHLTPEDNIFH